MLSLPWPRVLRIWEEGWAAGGSGSGEQTFTDPGRMEGNPGQEGYGLDVNDSTSPYLRAD